MYPSMVAVACGYFDRERGAASAATAGARQVGACTARGPNRTLVSVSVTAPSRPCATTPSELIAGGRGQHTALAAPSCSRLDCHAASPSHATGKVVTTTVLVLQALPPAPRAGPPGSRPMTTMTAGVP